MFNKIKSSLHTFLLGIIMGVANIIPGVSGGTIAVGLGIFDKLVSSINNFFKKPKETLPFLIPLGFGMVFGILAFSGIISFGLENYSFATNMFFVGLVVSSIPLIYKSSREKNFKPTYYIFVAIGFLVVLLFAIMENSSVSLTSSNVGYIKLFISGAIASSAMVIPGISGSFMMMLLGIYNILLESLSQLKDWLLNMSDTSLLFESFKVLVPLGIGIIIGVLLISKIIEFLFSKFHSQTYLVILGLIFGSIFAIMTDTSTYASGVNTLVIVSGVIMFILGFLLGSIFVKKDN